MKGLKILFVTCLFLILTLSCTGKKMGGKRKKKKKKKKVDDLGLGATAPVLVCTACTRVIGRIGVDVTKRLEKNELWSKSLKKKYKNMLRVACANREDFPMNNEIFLKGCAIFMSQYNKACLKKISNHLNPDADEFEEDIVEKEFCTELGACPDGMRSIDDHMGSPPPSKVREQDRRPPPPDAGGMDPNSIDIPDHIKNSL